MKTITFITGNQHKAEYLSKFLGFPVDHLKLDLDEIQSLDLHEIVEHKVKQAYDLIKKPVLVEDVALEFEALGGLPGPFIKFFLERVSDQDICSMISDGMTRKARGRCVYGYYDGEILKLMEGGMGGEIPVTPQGENGFGWDKIFIPEGYTITRAEMNAEEDEKTYMKIKPFAKLKEFLETLN